jgi:hypothetical protein
VAKPEERQELRDLREVIRKLDQEIAQYALLETLWTRTVAEVEVLLMRFDQVMAALLSSDHAFSLSALRLVETLEDAGRPAMPAPGAPQREGSAHDDAPPPRDLGNRADRAGKPHTLAVKVTSKGGEIHVRDSVLKTTLGFVGGVSVAFVHSDANGNILASGNLPMTRGRSVRVDELDELLEGSGTAQGPAR